MINLIKIFYPTVEKAESEILKSNLYIPNFLSQQFLVDIKQLKVIITE